MAFTISNYFNSGFDRSSVGTTEAELLTAIDAILRGPTFGSSAPKEWAQTAKVRLKDGDIAGAIEWLTGAMQPSKAKRAREKFVEEKRDIQKQLENFNANIANVTDFTNPNLTEAEKEAGRKRAEEIRASASELQALATQLGIAVPEPVRTASGYQVAGEVSTTPTTAPQSQGATFNIAGGTAPTTIPFKTGLTDAQKQSITALVASGRPFNETDAKNYAYAVGDSNWQKYVGTTGTTPTSGTAPTTVQTGKSPIFFDPNNPSALYYIPQGQTTPVRIANPQQLQELAQQGLIEVGTAYKELPRTTGGATTTPTTTPGGTTTSPVSSSILPAGVDIEGLTQEQVTSLEEAYLRAQEDSVLISAQTITDDDIAGFLEKAKSEYSPYYQQVFNRASEDFIRGIEFKGSQRALELKQERQALEQAMEEQANASAETGTVFSGIRRKAEERLQERAKDLASSSRASFNLDALNTGRQYEDLLGSRNLPTITATVEGQPIYTPAGGLTGALERERITAEQNRANQLEQEARQRAVGLIDPNAATF